MTMTSTVIAVLLAVGGGVIYHVAAKSVPRDAAPTLVLLVAYVTALAFTGLAHFSWDHRAGPRTVVTIAASRRSRCRCGSRHD